jgi:CheY-like chemotaxis protein
MKPQPIRRGDEPAETASSQVLVVDDEAVVREFLSRCLERGGYTVREAGSAAEALDVMAGIPAATVLCDIRMPGQDGLWLAERIRTRWPRTAIVMVTAIDDADSVRQSRRIGASAYLNKPIMPEQLLEVMRKVTAAHEEKSMSDDLSASAGEQASGSDKVDAEYTLESPVRCPACGERISTLKAVRLIRAQVNFTSTLPRRGRVIACPCCLAVIPAELTNF